MDGARGRCLCGAIAYAVTGPLADVLDCHCHRCRRFTGHYLAATRVAIQDLQVRDPGALLTWYDVPGAAYGFCRRCGSSLFWRADAHPERWSVAAGTLDLPTGLRTAEAWWVSEAGDYHERPDVPERERE